MLKKPRQLYIDMMRYTYRLPDEGTQLITRVKKSTQTL